MHFKSCAKQLKPPHLNESQIRSFFGHLAAVLANVHNDGQTTDGWTLQDVETSWNFVQDV